MKTFQFSILGAIAILQIWCSGLLANDASRGQLQFSITLSGHLMLGLGYCYFWNAHHAVQGAFYLVPERGLPYGIAGGYRFDCDEGEWRPTIGAEAMVLASPPDPNQRKFLPMIKIEPGVIYQLASDHELQSRLWIAYFLKKTRARLAPIGLEFGYGKRF